MIFIKTKFHYRKCHANCLIWPQSSCAELLWLILRNEALNGIHEMWIKSLTLLFYLNRCLKRKVIMFSTLSLTVNTNSTKYKCYLWKKDEILSGNVFDILFWCTPLHCRLTDILPRWLTACLHQMRGEEEPWLTPDTRHGSFNIGGAPGHCGHVVTLEHYQPPQPHHCHSSTQNITLKTLKYGFFSRFSI